MSRKITHFYCLRDTESGHLIGEREKTGRIILITQGDLDNSEFFVYVFTNKRDAIKAKNQTKMESEFSPVVEKFNGE